MTKPTTEVTTTLVLDTSRIAGLLAGAARPRTRVVSPPGSFVLVRETPDGARTFTAPRPENPFARLGRIFGDLKQAIGLSLMPTVAKMAADLDRTMAQVHAVLRASAPSTVAANDLVRIEGLGARFYVRAGLDPECATDEGLSTLVRRLLAGDRDYDPDLALVTPENRRRLAVSAILGWVSSHAAPAEPFVAHRAWGSTSVEVRCG